MARIPYIKEDEHPELAATIAGIRARRHGDLSPVARMLLHSPELAEGWMKMFTVIRYQTTFPAKLRELIVARVGIRNGARYEVAAHRHHALEEGITPAQLDALADWRNSDLFDSTERAVLNYTDAITDDIQVSDEAFAGVRALFNDRQMVELTGTIASYSFVSRFLVALQIEPGE
jgi:AhpD family alkylhydroperoxidase